MAHELEIIDGKASFFEVGAARTAWHQLGEHVVDAPDLDGAIALAKLDYEVKKLPVTVKFPTEDGADTYEVESTKAWTTWRMDRKIELGAVGPDYQVVQNTDAFRLTIGPLVDEGILALETGGVLRNGADAWLLGRFDLTRFGPICREVFADEVLPFALVSVNHSGRRGNTVALTMIRAVCANTLGMVENEVDGHHDASRGGTIRHTGDVEGKMIEQALTLFAGLVERAERVAESYRLLKNFRITDAQLRELVVEPAIDLHPTERAKWNPDARQADSVIERWEAREAAIEMAWHYGKGHVDDGSAWEAYNGLVEVIDHNTDLFPSRGGVYRTQGLMEGELRKAKDRAYGALVAAATEA